MKKDFFQAVCDELVEKRVFAAFPELRSLDLTEKRIKELQKNLRRDVYLNSAIKTGQDPVELKNMVLESFDKATKKMREAISQLYDKVAIPAFEEAKKKQ